MFLKTGWYFLQTALIAGRSRIQQQKFQERKLREIIRHAYHNSRFYRELFDSKGIKPEDIQTIADLKKLPQTARRDVQLYFDKFLAHRKNLVFSNTTGSSGAPLKTAMSADELHYSRAIEIYSHFKAGRSVFGKMLTLRAMEARRVRGFFKSLGVIRDYFFDLRKPVPDLVNAINKLKPTEIRTYPSCILLIARYISHEKMRIHSPHVIITDGETLYPETKHYIEKIFRCPVRDQYGSTEFHQLSYECAEGNKHLFANAAVIEEENNDLLITSLYKKAMPLIRYRIGDHGSLSYDYCPCGSSAPMLTHIIGRVDDYITLPSGRKISARAINLMEDISGILEYQTIQKKKNLIEVLVVPTSSFSKETEYHIRHTIQEGCLGEDVKVAVKKTTRLPRASNGKKRKILSLV